jgi:hypothetical protein
MYVLATDENILYSANLASGQLTGLLNNSISGTLATSAVYQRDGVVELYYLTATDVCSSYNLTRNINGATTTLLTNVARSISYCSSLALYLDSTGSYTYVTTAPSSLARYDLVAVSGSLEVLSGALGIYGWVLLDDSTILYSNTDLQFFSFNIADFTSTAIKDVPGGTQVGWYTCGDELLAQLPSSPAAAASSCASNGLVWVATFQAAYYGTVAAFETKTLSSAGDACTGNTLYERICTTVSHLPPYICERDVPQPIFTVLSTALANAQFFMVVLLMGFAYTMDQIAKREEGTDVAPAAKGDVEMMTTTPMHGTERVNA